MVSTDAMVANSVIAKAIKPAATAAMPMPMNQPHFARSFSEGGRWPGMSENPDCGCIVMASCSPPMGSNDQ